MINCERQFRFYGLRRSGNHAIIKWMQGMLGDFTHLNDVCIPGIHDHAGRKDGEMTFGYPGTPPEHTESLIVSFEDIPILGAPAKITEDRFGPVGQSIKHVVVIRDFGNWYASLCSSVFKTVHINQYVGMWKQYAKICFESKGFIIPAVFNKWFVSQEYRMELANKLGLEFSDKNINELGWQSTFDGKRHHHTARQMKVLDRWQNYKSDGQFLKFMADPEICKYQEYFK